MSGDHKYKGKTGYVPFNLIQHSPCTLSGDNMTNMPWDDNLLYWLERNVGSLIYSSHSDEYIEKFNKKK